MENIPLKQQRGYHIRQKKKRTETIEEIWLERGAEFRGANNASMAISMTSTVRSC
jgi:hypothetical protein